MRMEKSKALAYMSGKIVQNIKGIGNDNHDMGYMIVLMEE